MSSEEKIKIQGWRHGNPEGKHDQTVDSRGPEHRTHPPRSTSAEILEEDKIAPPIHTSRTPSTPSYTQGQSRRVGGHTLGASCTAFSMIPRSDLLPLEHKVVLHLCWEGDDVLHQVCVYHENPWLLPCLDECAWCGCLGVVEVQLSNNCFFGNDDRRAIQMNHPVAAHD